MPKKSNKEKKSEKIVHKPLGTSLQKGGFQLTQIKREGDVALFSKERIKKPWCSHYEAGYEVAVIKRHNGYHLGGQFIEPTETYPCDSLWGVLGWTCMTLQEAEAKYKEVKQKLDAKLIDTNVEVTAEEEE